MLLFNNKEFQLGVDITLAQLMEIMKSRNVIDTKTALLITVNNKLITPADFHKVIIKEGDVILTRLMPSGG